MENNFFSGLSRTFEAYFPQIRPIVEETVTYYSNQFKPKHQFDYSNVTKVGTFTISDDEVDSVLPKLIYTVPPSVGKNPNFYLVTSPDGAIIYVGTTEKGKIRKPLSASTITGGLLPSADSKDAYFVYLRVMSAVRYYGHCDVYSVDTKFNKDFLDQYGKSYHMIGLEQAVDNIVAHITTVGHASNQDNDAKQVNRLNEIWNKVKVFGEMYKSGLLNLITGTSFRLCSKDGDSKIDSYQKKMREEDNGYSSYSSISNKLSALKAKVKNTTAIDTLFEAALFIDGKNIVIDINKNLADIDDDLKQVEEDNKIKGIISKKVVDLCNPSRDRDVCTDALLASVMMSNVPYAGKGTMDAIDNNKGASMFTFGAKCNFEALLKTIFPCEIDVIYGNMSALPLEERVNGVNRITLMGGPVVPPDNSIIVISPTDEKTITIQEANNILGKVHECFGSNFESWRGVVEVGKPKVSADKILGYAEATKRHCGIA